MLLRLFRLYSDAQKRSTVFEFRWSKQLMGWDNVPPSPPRARRPSPSLPCVSVFLRFGQGGSACVRVQVLTVTRCYLWIFASGKCRKRANNSVSFTIFCVKINFV